MAKCPLTPSEASTFAMSRIASELRGCMKSSVSKKNTTLVGSAAATESAATSRTNLARFVTFVILSFCLPD